MIAYHNTYIEGLICIEIGLLSAWETSDILITQNVSHDIGKVDTFFKSI